LVADHMAMARLLLPGLEAVGVAEEARRVDEADLLHLVGGERDQRGNVSKAVHARLIVARAGGDKRVASLAVWQYRGCQMASTVRVVAALGGRRVFRVRVDDVDELRA